MDEALHEVGSSATLVGDLARAREDRAARGPSRRDAREACEGDGAAGGRARLGDRARGRAGRPLLRRLRRDASVTNKRDGQARRSCVRATTSAKSRWRWTCRARRRSQRSRPRSWRAATGRHSMGTCARSSRTTLKPPRSKQRLDDFLTVTVTATGPSRTTDEFYASASASTASLKRGHASVAQSPNSLSVSTPHASPASGSTQRNVPAAPKWPNVLAELRAPVQCGDLWSRSSKASPQSFGSMPAEARQHTREARELDGRRLVERLAGDERRGEQLARRASAGRRAGPCTPRRASRSALPRARAARRRRTRSSRQRAFRRARRRARPPPRCRRSNRSDAAPAPSAAGHRPAADPTHAQAGAGASSPRAPPARRDRPSPPRPRRAPRGRSAASSRTPTAMRCRADHGRPPRLRRASPRRPRVRAPHSSIARSAFTAGDTRAMERRFVTAVSPQAASVGYSRAVARRPSRPRRRNGAVYPDGVDTPADAVLAGEAVSRDHRRGARRIGRRARARRPHARLTSHAPRLGSSRPGARRGLLAHASCDVVRRGGGAPRPELARRDRSGGADPE